MNEETRVHERHGRIYTSGMSFQRRIYEVLGVDLGEGVDRSSFLRGFVALLGWFVFLMLCRFPFSPYTFAIYTLPPVLLMVVGSFEAKITRRTRWKSWAASVRWLRFGHRTIFTHRAPTPNELLPLGDRIRHRVGGVQELFVDTHQVREADKSRPYQAGYGTEMKWNVQPRHMTQAQADKLVARHALKRRGK